MTDFILILRKVAVNDLEAPDSMEWGELFTGAAAELEKQRTALEEIAEGTWSSDTMPSKIISDMRSIALNALSEEPK